MDAPPPDPGSSASGERLSVGWGNKVLAVSGPNIICVILTLAAMGGGVYFYDMLLRVLAGQQQQVVTILHEAQSQRARLEERQSTLDERLKDLVQNQTVGLDLLQSQTKEMKIQTWLGSLPVDQRPRLLIPAEALDRLERVREEWRERLGGSGGK